jgi:hypothetical protein
VFIEAAPNLVTHTHMYKSVDCDGWEEVINGVCWGVGGCEGIITHPNMERFEAICREEDGFIGDDEEDLYYEWREYLLKGETKVAWVLIGVKNDEEREGMVDEENPYMGMDKDPPGRKFFIADNLLSTYEQYLEHRPPEEKEKFMVFKLSWKSCVLTV